MPDHNADRSEAILWARSVLETPVIILDTETTGFGDDRDDEIVQMGAVLVTGGEIVDIHNRYYWPAVAPRPGAAERTGLDMEALRARDAIWFGEDFPRLWRFLAHQRIIAYNAAYDSKLLGMTCVVHRLPHIPATWECAMEMYAQFYGEWNDYHGNYRWQKLEAACARHGLEVKDAHDALGDVRMTLALVKYMAAQLTGLEQAQQALDQNLTLTPRQIEVLEANSTVGRVE